MKSAEQLLGLIFLQKRRLLIEQGGHYPQQFWTGAYIIDGELMAEIEDYLEDKKLRDDNRIDQAGESR